MPYGYSLPNTQIYGQSGALNYEIAPMQVGQGAPVQPGQPQVGPPQGPQLPEDRLGGRQQDLARLYESYGQLESFMRDMRTQGVDPTIPDFSQGPDGGLAHQTYMNLDALVRFASNDLANQQVARDKALPYQFENKLQLAPGVTQDTVDFRDPSQYVATTPTWATQQAAGRLSERTTTKGAQDRLNHGVYDEQAANIDNMVAQGVITAAQGEAEKANLFKNTYNPPVFQPSSSSGIKPAVQGGLELLKAVTNHVGGNWEPGSYQEQVVGGKRVNVSTRFANHRLGEVQLPKQDSQGNKVLTTVPLIIQRSLRDPNTGEVTIQFTDPDLPDRVVTGRDGEALTTQLIESNSRYGGASAIPEVFQAAKESGFFNPANQLIQETQITDKSVGRPVEVNPKVDEAIAAKSTQIKSDMKAMILDGKFKAGRGIPLPDGRSLDLIYEGKERGKGLYITNPDDFPELPKLTNFNPQEIIDLISAEGYFDLDKAKRIFPIGGTQPSDFSSPPQSGTPGLTARQQKALAAFEIQTKRKPTKQELQSILTKYKW